MPTHITGTKRLYFLEVSVSGDLTLCKTVFLITKQTKVFKNNDK